MYILEHNHNQNYNYNSFYMKAFYFLFEIVHIIWLGSQSSFMSQCGDLWMPPPPHPVVFQYQLFFMPTTIQRSEDVRGHHSLLCTPLNTLDLWMPPSPHPIVFQYQFLIGCPPPYRDPKDVRGHHPLPMHATEHL